MLADIENLLLLQAADREIARLRDDIAALPRRVAAIEQKLAGTKACLEQARATIKADEAARRKHETAVQALQQKISKYRDQSLAVKTNEQYKALLHEIQFAEQDIRSNEDKILEFMLDAEAREKEVREAEAELKAETEEIEKEKTEARERTAQDEKELADWGAKRTTLRTSVNPDLLRHYERVSQFRGTGLSEVRDHKCLGCQVMLRPQVYNDVRASQQIVYCDSCQRILYFNPANDEPVVEKPAPPRRRRPRPKADAAEAWYYRTAYSESGEVFLCFINGQGSSSRRVYDAAIGRKIGETLLREGEYHLAFPEDVTGSVRLNGSWEEAELEEMGAELPMIVLDTLQRDLEAARAETRAAHPASGAEPDVPSEHTAAS